MYFLLLLLAADLAYIVLHLLLRLTPLLDNPLLALTRDRGYPEFYQYVKVFWIILLLVMTGVTTRTAGYAAWVLLFVYLLLDDALQLHENLGVQLAASFGFVPLVGLRTQDLGELAVSAVSGTLLLGLISGSYLRGADPFRQASRRLLLLVLVVVFFGVFVDMLHMMLNTGPTMDLVFEVIEDGGELVAMSVVAWYVFLLTIRNARS